MRQEEKSQINNLSSHLTNLEKQNKFNAREMIEIEI